MPGMIEDCGFPLATCLSEWRHIAIMAPRQQRIEHRLSKPACHGPRCVSEPLCRALRSIVHERSAFYEPQICLSTIMWLDEIYDLLQPSVRSCPWGTEASVSPVTHVSTTRPGDRPAQFRRHRQACSVEVKKSGSSLTGAPIRRGLRPAMACQVR